MITAEVYTKNALVNTIASPRLQLKYRLKECFIRFCGCEDAVRRAKQHLCDAYDIPASTLNYDLNLRASDNASVPAERLHKYAAYFGIHVTDLVETF